MTGMTGMTDTGMVRANMVARMTRMTRDYWDD